ncbi:MAG TPA: hypothetical protein VLL76_04150 [Candidatus Omnitrophota bacterium]|nr:hypothetical protein [Candidatus Omnitrophota bacterium]
MRTVILAALCTLALSGCSSAPRPLVPDTAQGPASYVCYSSMVSNPEEVRAIAERQCGRWGYGVAGLIGQSWTPLRCGALTPTVAAFQCGSGSVMAPLPALPPPEPAQ